MKRIILSVAVTVAAFLGGIAAIPITTPLVIPQRTADQCYIKTLSVDVDNQSIVMTVPIGTGNGAAFRPIGQPAIVTVNAADFGELMGILRECKDTTGVSAYDRASAFLTSKIQSSNALVIRE